MLRGLRILVVEDERGVRLLLGRVLADAGAAGGRRRWRSRRRSAQRACRRCAWEALGRA